MAEGTQIDEEWRRDTIVEKVMKIVCSRFMLPHKDLVTLLLVSPSLYRSLTSYTSLWPVIDLREFNNAGDRLLAALSLARYHNVNQINLEFAQGVEDKHMELLRIKNISDKSLQLIADNYQRLESLNLTRCIKLTDGGLQQILCKCCALQTLNLYADSSFTDVAYKNFSFLADLRFLDLCGAQNLSDEGVYVIAKCKNLVSLNLTWCVRVTDMGVISIAQGCTSLEFLSLFGIVGVTDKCLEALSLSCSNTITTLDVNGCIGIKRRSREELLQLFPHIRCFKVHS